MKQIVFSHYLLRLWLKYIEQRCLFRRQQYNERKTIFQPSVIKHHGGGGVCGLSHYVAKQPLSSQCTKKNSQRK